jgi:O-antigen ligase
MNRANPKTRFSLSGVVAALMALLLLLPLAIAPELRLWRSLCLVPELIALLLLGLALAQQPSWPRGRIRASLFRPGPHAPVFLLLLWGAISWWRASSPEFGRAEWIRLACGAGLYFVVAALKRRHQIERLVDTLIGVVILTALSGLTSITGTDSRGLTYPFGNSQLLAGFLILFIPLLVVFSFSEPHPLRKCAAQVATALSMAALALAETRSAWIGVIVGLVALGLMQLRRGSVVRQWTLRKHEWIVPVIVMTATCGLFLVLSRSTSMLGTRASTLAAPVRDASFQWRLDMWRGGWQLIRRRPLFGWGIGSFPLEQSRTAHSQVPREIVERMGPTLAQEAHNEYIQTAAEMGVVGLGLYLWVLGAFFAMGWRALRRSEPGLPRRVLMGCLAAVAGQTIDALSNPAWRFAEVSFLFWVILGLGVAAASRRRIAHAEPEAAPAAIPPRPLVWRAASLALTPVLMGAAWGVRGYSPVPNYPKPIQLSIRPSPVTLQPGQCVEFHVFADVQDSDPVEVTNQPDTQLFTRLGNGQCLVGQAASGKPNVFCVPQDACSSAGCAGDRTVPVFATFGHPQLTATARVVVSCPAVHDVAITALQVPSQVSRSADATVMVTVANRGTQAEQCHLRLRVQPGQMIISDDPVTLGPGETKTLTLTWPTALMGNDGPKTLVAELILDGSQDIHPDDNQAIQVVIVGP